MRTGYFLPCLLVLVAAVLLGGGSQRSGAQQGKGKGPDLDELFLKVAKGRDHVLFNEVNGRRELELFAWENRISDGKLTRDQFVKYLSQREELQKRLRDAWAGDPADLFRL